MKIIAIIVTYNASSWIEKCFGSLIHSSLPIKLLAIDNNSTDGTPSIIKDKFPQVEVIETGLNLGFGKANNIGLARAVKEEYDYVLLLNQDAWVELDTIKKLIKIHQLNQNFAVLAPMQFNGSGSLIDKLFFEYSVKPNRNLMSDCFIKKGELKEVYPADFLNAACWLLPKSTMQKNGGFDPLFPHYGEDNDYINRVLYHGDDVGLCPNLNVFHDRENREPSKKIEDIINKNYVGLLFNLKDGNIQQPAITYYIILWLSYLVKWFFGKNKSFYKAQSIAVIRIIRNYYTIVNHRVMCQQQKSHFIS